MKQLKGRLQLTKFRIKQNPITLLLLIVSLVLLTSSIVTLIHKNISVAFPLAILSFTCSMIGSNILKDITRKHQVEINEIKLKYGIKVNLSKEVK